MYGKLYEEEGEVFATRASREQYELIKKHYPKVEYDALSHILKIEKKEKTERKLKKIKEKVKKVSKKDKKTDGISDDSTVINDGGLLKKAEEVVNVENHKN